MAIKVTDNYLSWPLAFYEILLPQRKNPEPSVASVAAQCDNAGYKMAV
jgi:hypothetical protein